MRTLININVQIANHGLLYLPLLSKCVCWVDLQKKSVFQSLSPEIWVLGRSVGHNVGGRQIPGIFIFETCVRDVHRDSWMVTTP